VKCHHCFIRIL